LISRANTRELLGSAALIEENVRGRLLLCDKLYRLKIAKMVNGLYLLCFLRSSIARYQYEREATGASGSMQNIGQDTILNLQLPLPPIEEQQLISETLRKRLEANDRLKNKIDTIISSLKEYRTALITAAVTGKIDVRNFKTNQMDKSTREAA
jgi:type I restriction enzyme S subunit